MKRDVGTSQIIRLMPESGPATPLGRSPAPSVVTRKLVCDVTVVTVTAAPPARAGGKGCTSCQPAADPLRWLRWQTTSLGCDVGDRTTMKARPGMSGLP